MKENLQCEKNGFVDEECPCELTSRGERRCEFPSFPFASLKLKNKFQVTWCFQHFPTTGCFPMLCVVSGKTNERYYHQMMHMSSRESDFAIQRAPPDLVSLFFILSLFLLALPHQSGSQFGIPLRAPQSFLYCNDIR